MLERGCLSVAREPGIGDWFAFRALVREGDQVALTAREEARRALPQPPQGLLDPAWSTYRPMRPAEIASRLATAEATALVAHLQASRQHMAHRWLAARDGFPDALRAFEKRPDRPRATRDRPSDDLALLRALADAAVQRGVLLHPSTRGVRPTKARMREAADQADALRGALSGYLTTGAPTGDRLYSTTFPEPPTRAHLTDLLADLSTELRAAAMSPARVTRTDPTAPDRAFIRTLIEALRGRCDADTLLRIARGLCTAVGIGLSGEAVRQAVTAAARQG